MRAPSLKSTKQPTIIYNVLLARALKADSQSFSENWPPKERLAAALMSERKNGENKSAQNPTTKKIKQY